MSFGSRNMPVTSFRARSVTIFFFVKQHNYLIRIDSNIIFSKNLELFLKHMKKLSLPLMYTKLTLIKKNNARVSVIGLIIWDRCSPRKD